MTIHTILDLHGATRRPEPRQLHRRRSLARRLYCRIPSRFVVQQPMGGMGVFRVEVTMRILDDS